MELITKSSLWKPVLKAGGAAAINRFANIGIRLFTIPLTINYLGQEKYGLWITISSIAGYILLLDFGISSAMVNKLTTFYTEKDTQSADKYILSNLLFFALISVLIISLVAIAVPNFDWISLMKLKALSSRHEINMLLIVCVLMFLLQLSTTIVLKIPYAMQNGSLSEAYLLVGNIISFAGIILCVKLDLGLITLVIFLTSSSFVASILIIIHLLTAKQIHFYWIKFSEILFLIKDLRKTGFDFIIIQLTGVILIGSQFSILAYYHGAESVAPYGIMFQIMLAIQTPFSVLQQPMWSKFVELSVQKNNLAIGNAIKKYIKYAILYSIFVAVVLVFLIPYILPLVIKKPIAVPLNLRIGFAIWSAFGLIVGGGVGASLLAMNLTRPLAIISVIQFVVFFISAFFFVPSFSAFGMVMSIVLMQVVSAPLTFSLLQKRVFK